MLRIGENILYPALHRLEAGGQVAGAWGKTPTGREARIYQIEAKGRARLERESGRWIARSQAALDILQGEGA